MLSLNYWVSYSVCKKISFYKKKNMADRISIYKAKTNSFFEENKTNREFLCESIGEEW